MLIQTVDKTTYRGYLTEISSDSLSLFVPKLSLDTTISINEIYRIAALKKGYFWNSFVKGFAISEAALMLLTANERDSFIQVFIFVIGNVLIVAPTSLMSGLVSATPDIRLDISSDSNGFEMLHGSKLSRYSIPHERLRHTSNGIRQLNKMKFSGTKNRPSLQLDYSPRFYLQLFEPGFWWNNIGSQIMQKYSGNYDDSYDERPGNIETTVGLAWSPSMNWEFGCQFSTNSTGEVGFINNGSNQYSSINFSYSYYTQNIYALRRFSPYQNGYGNRWQISIGALMSHISSLTTTYITAENEFTWYSDERSKAHDLFGLGLMGSMDYYITKHFSVCLRLQSSWFTPMQIDGFTQETYNVHWDEFNVNPVITTLSLGLRSQF